MFSIEFGETLTGASLPYEALIADLRFEPDGADPVLIAATEVGGGMAEYRLEAGASLSLGAAHDYGARVAGLSGVDLIRVSSGAQNHVVPTGAAFADWTGYLLSPDDGLGPGQGWDVSGVTPVANRPAASATVGSASYLFSVAANGVDVTIGQVGADLTLRAASVFRNAVSDGRITALAATPDGMLFAAVDGGGALASYRIGAGGRLSALDRTGAGDGLGIARPVALETVTLDDRSYVILAAAGSGTLTVFEVAADGGLTVTDHVMDTRDTRFGGVSELAVVRSGPWQFVLAAGADDGVSVFSLLPGGRLLHMDSVADSSAAALSNVSALAAGLAGGALQIFTASQREAGISRFTVDLSTLGEIRSGDGSGAILAATGADDILVSGGGADRLRGGGGADVFVFSTQHAAADGGLGAVLDFTPGQDRIDLSSLPLLHHIDQLDLRAAGSGVTLQFADWTVDIAGPGVTVENVLPAIMLGTGHLPLGNLEVPPEDPSEPGPSPEPPAGPPSPDPVPPPPDPVPEGGGPDTESGGGSSPDPDSILSGGAGADLLVGGDGNDLIIGAGGQDTLIAGSGADVLYGGDGNDRLLGEAGNDTLNGGDGADTINGGDGDDQIIGGETDADLRDVIYAGEGNDSVDGGYGNDLIYGQGGNDTMAGGFGVDELQGQDGDDVITGSAYSDLVFGGDGNDFVNGGFGSDRINGGAGADKFFHVGVRGHGSDWIQDYVSGDGDVLLFGNAAATRSQFQVNFAHTADSEGERSGDDAVQEAFVIYRPTGQIMWALVDGEGQDQINLQIGGEVFDLLV